MAEPEHAPNPKRQRRLFLLRLLLSAGLLGILFVTIDLQTLFSAITRVSITEVLLFFVILVVGALLHAWKWGVMLRAWEIDLAYPVLFKWVLIGLFFSNFLPGGLGSDISRLYQSGRLSDQRAKSAAVIVYDRIYSLTALLVLAMGALIFWPGTATQRLIAAITFAVILLLIGGFVAMANSPLISRMAEWVTERLGIGLLDKVVALANSMRFSSTHYRTLAFAFVLALIMQVVDVYAHYVIAEYLDYSINILDMFIFVPILYIITALPITINGLGIRELAFVLFFNPLGLPESNAVSFSLVYFGLVLLFSLIGGVLYLLSNAGRARREDAT